MTSRWTLNPLHSLPIPQPLMAELPQPSPPSAPSLHNHVYYGSLITAGGGAGNNSSLLMPNADPALASGADGGPPLYDLDLLMLLSLGGEGMDQGMDKEQAAYRKALTYYLMGIIGSVVCCLGTIANALSVAVLTRRTMRSSTYMYLASLAVCDSLVLFFTLLLILKDTRPPDSPRHMDHFHAVLFPFVHPTAVVFQVSDLSALFVWLVGFLTSSSTTRLYRGRAPRQSV